MKLLETFNYRYFIPYSGADAHYSTDTVTRYRIQDIICRLEFEIWL